MPMDGYGTVGKVIVRWKKKKKQKRIRTVADGWIYHRENNRGAGEEKKTEKDSRKDGGRWVDAISLKPWKILLIAADSRVGMQASDHNHMMISTYTITQEYSGSSLVISVLDTDMGGTKFSTVSAVQGVGKTIVEQKKKRKPGGFERRLVKVSMRGCERLEITTVHVNYVASQSGRWMDLS